MFLLNNVIVAFKYFYLVLCKSDNRVLAGMLVLLLLFPTAGAAGCGYGEVESAGDPGRCVAPLALLLGGSDLRGWRRDGELWSEEGPVQDQVPDFPYTIDAPFGWWSRAGAVVCGGKEAKEH